MEEGGNNVMEKGKILLIISGGTIGMKPDEKGILKPSGDKELIRLFPHLEEIASYDVEYFANIDSSDMQPEMWSQLAELVYLNYDKYKAFVITHGTDTMAYTAAALSFSLQGLTKPVILTGSQIPASIIGSDANTNLINAFKVATYEKITLPEVCIVFGLVILRGNRAIKKSERDLNAFEISNTEQIGLLGRIMLDIQIYPYAIHRTDQYNSIQLINKFEKGVMPLKLYPGLAPRYIHAIIENMKDCRGIVLEAFGAGNVPDYADNSLIPIIKKATDKGIPVVITTQCPGGSANLTLYELGYKALEAGAISAYDMTAETTIVKLMWALAQTSDLNKIKKIMQHNYAGEISEIQAG